MKSFVIGISGASGSGKSTFSEKLCALLPNCYYLNIDKHYKKVLPTVISPLDGKSYPDWNHPDSIDIKSACSELLEAQNKAYSYIIVDGAFIFCMPELDKLIDYRIYIDASIEMRIYRRIKRNVISKNQSIEQIGEYYLKAARYREREYSLPSAEKADIRIDNEDGFEVSPEDMAKAITARSSDLI